MGIEAKLESPAGDWRFIFYIKSKSLYVRHINKAALSREGVVSSHSMIATGLCSRHGSEFGTLRAARSCGLETVAQAILGALKSLQRRSKAGHWQHSSFATVYQQLASSQLLPIFAAQRALQEFRI